MFLLPLGSCLAFGCDLFLCARSRWSLLLHAWHVNNKKTLAWRFRCSCGRNIQTKPATFPYCKLTRSVNLQAALHTRDSATNESAQRTPSEVGATLARLLQAKAPSLDPRAPAHSTGLAISLARGAALRANRHGGFEHTSEPSGPSHVNRSWYRQPLRSSFV